MKETIIPLSLSFIAGLSTLLGGLLIFIKTKRVEELITFSLSLSLGIMILVSVLDLLPYSIPIMISKYNYIGIIISMLVFLLGYLFIYIIENKLKEDTSNLHKIGIISMISLILHNLPEGIIVFISAYTNIAFGLKICLSIMLHNIPEGISIAIPLYYSGESRGSVLKKTLLSGLTEPLGALFTLLILGRVVNELMLSYMLIFVSGLMISLSINNILKEIIKYNNKKYIILGIIFSCIITLFVLI